MGGEHGVVVEAGDGEVRHAQSGGRHEVRGCRGGPGSHLKVRQSILSPGKIESFHLLTLLLYLVTESWVPLRWLMLAEKAGLWYPGPARPGPGPYLQW